MSKQQEKPVVIFDEARFCLSSAASDELRAKVQPNLEGDASGGMLPFITGYAAMYDMPADSGMGFDEVVRRGAFTRSLQDNEDVIAAPEHDWDRAVARRSAVRMADGKDVPGVLYLEDREEGLFYKFRPIDTVDGRRMLEQVRSGVMTHSSFRFRVRNNKSTRVTVQAGGRKLRELLDVRLRDVAPVMQPFYPATSVRVSRASGDDEVRSLTTATQALLDACEMEEKSQQDGMKHTAQQAAQQTAMVEHLQTYAKVLKATSV